MRIRLETADRLPYWLVGDPGLSDRVEASSALAEGLQITRNQQIVSGSDWETVLGVDRGNQRVVLTATTRREFDSEEARLSFITSLAALDPVNQLHRWSGDVYARIDTGEATFVEYAMPRSVVALTALTLEAMIGLKLTYQITAGGFGESAGGVGNGLVELLAWDNGRNYLDFDASVVDARVNDFFAAGAVFVRLERMVLRGNSPFIALHQSLYLWQSQAQYEASTLYDPGQTPLNSIGGTHFTLPSSRIFSTFWPYVAGNGSIALFNETGLTAEIVGDVMTIIQPSPALYPNTALRWQLTARQANPYVSGATLALGSQSYPSAFYADEEYILTADEDTTTYQLTALDE